MPRSAYHCRASRFTTTKNPKTTTHAADTEAQKQTTPSTQSLRPNQPQPSMHHTATMSTKWRHSTQVDNNGAQSGPWKKMKDANLLKVRHVANNTDPSPRTAATNIDTSRGRTDRNPAHPPSKQQENIETPKRPKTGSSYDRLQVPVVCLQWIRHRLIQLSTHQHAHIHRNKPHRHTC
jgi:hypothetical protein